MAELQACPECRGSGMAGASSCTRCRGTGAIKARDEKPLFAQAISVPPTEDDISPEERAAVEQELAAALDAPRLRVKKAQVRLSPSGRKGRGLSFKA